MSNPFQDGNYETNGNPYANYTQEQLRQKQLELDRKEQQLEYQERIIADEKKTYVVDHPPNWPRCKPVIYHDIKAEIPESGRSLVTRIYFSWLMSLVCLVINMVSLLAGVIVDPNQGVSFGISIAILLLGLLLPFVFWYRPLYKAVKNDSGLNYFFFFFSYTWHILLAVIYAIGIPSSGGGGFIVAVQVFNISVGAGVILIISGGLWSLLALFCILQFLMTIRHYRNRGHTLKGDATNIAKDAATSEAGRAVIAEGGKAVVSGAAQQYSS